MKTASHSAGLLVASLGAGRMRKCSSTRSTTDQAERTRQLTKPTQVVAWLPARKTAVISPTTSQVKATQSDSRIV